MNWEAIGAIGEVVGAVAVILTLAYLALQIRQNTATLRSDATNNAATAIQSWYLAIGVSEQASRLWFKGMTDPDSLPQEDFFQFVMMTHASMLGFQNSYQLAEQGALDVEIRESLTNILIAAKSLPGFQVYWQQRGPMFNKGFQEYVEGIQKRDSAPTQELYEAQTTNK